MDENIEKLVTAAQNSLADSTFIKLVLSNYKGREHGLQKIIARVVETKHGPRLMFQSRFDTRDIVKNFAFEDGPAEIGQRLGSGFRNAHLFTAGGDLQLTIGKRNSRLVMGKASARKPASTSHDRQKKTLIDPNAFYLKALGIANDKGEIKPSQQDKWRQINKFVEILAGLIDASPIKEKQELRIVDMGSGKGYLTFAAYDHLANMRAAAAKRTVQMTGIEQRPELVDLCNEIAAAVGFEGLKFMQGQIADLDAAGIDILIALHACDTATDDALYKGITANASIIVAAPCCHKQVRRQAEAARNTRGHSKTRHNARTHRRDDNGRHPCAAARTRGLFHKGFRICADRTHAEKQYDNRRKAHNRKEF
ncbi:MAG: SAM-dependent methyltransferase [Acidobacteria bacterium]|nr:SAM-dependent methyltransferase [Acidobacteriota bacterium]